MNRAPQSYAISDDVLLVCKEFYAVYSQLNNLYGPDHIFLADRRNDL